MRSTSAVLRALNGLISVYKPPEMPIAVLLHKLRKGIVADLNALPLSVPALTSSVQTNDNDASLIVTTAPDILRDNPLLWGPRFRSSDLPIHPVAPLSPFSSGLQVVGLGSWGVRLAKRLENAQLIRVYRLKLRLGRATLDGTSDSLTSLRTSWRHVTQTKIDRLCAAVQAQHQRSMFGAFPRNSQEAFELASRGLIRPPPLRNENSDPPPLLFALRCVEFSPPEAVLEAHCVNETCQFLVHLCDAFGRRLRAATCCAGIRRIRHGRLVVGPECLLVKEWRLADVQRNLQHCGTVQPPESLRFETVRFGAIEGGEQRALPQEPQKLIEIK